MERLQIEYIFNERARKEMPKVSVELCQRKR